MRHDAAKAVRPARTAPLTGARPVPRRGGRVVEGTGLENRQACKRLVGSNPTPSAKRSSYPLLRDNPGHTLAEEGGQGFHGRGQASS